MLMRPRRKWAHSVSGWSESTFAEQAWEASRGAGLRWAVIGGLLGLLIGVIAFAPAAWLARAVASGSDDRVILADARGTIWSGSAVMVLTGGPGSRDANSLPGRMEWSLGLRGLGFELRARHDCCLNGTVRLGIKPGFGRVTLSLGDTGDYVGQWPAALLGGLGTPFNTMQLGGGVRITTPGVTLEAVQGRLRVDGQLSVELMNVSSRLVTLEQLGSYRLTIAGDPQNPGTSQLTLETTEGALQLTGSGTWSPAGVRFRGEATASPGDEPALNNLLNIIGRRNGARSVISIG